MQYAGFSVPAMLEAIGRYSDRVQLRAAPNDIWCLQVERDGQVFEFAGSMGWAVIQAFKPLQVRASQDKEQIIDRVIEACTPAHEVGAHQIRVRLKS